MDKFSPCQTIYTAYAGKPHSTEVILTLGSVPWEKKEKVGGFTQYQIMSVGLMVLLSLRFDS